MGIIEAVGPAVAKFKPGGQAEFVRILKADSNRFKVDDALGDEQVLFPGGIPA